MVTHASRPTRLHHTAYVTRNLEATRHFYEDIIGLPLVATWCEVEPLFGAERTYCHLFFELEDTSALAFFKFATAEDEALFGPAIPSSPFYHIALNVDQQTQSAIEGRLIAAGYQAPAMYVLEHGYCRSVYIKDPNNIIIEFTYDDPHALAQAPIRRALAHTELRRWMAGDHAPNNALR